MWNVASREMCLISDMIYHENIRTNYWRGHTGLLGIQFALFRFVNSWSNFKILNEIKTKIEFGNTEHVKLFVFLKVIKIQDDILDIWQSTFGVKFCWHLILKNLWILKKISLPAAAASQDYQGEFWVGFSNTMLHVVQYSCVCVFTYLHSTILSIYLPKY